MEVLVSVKTLGVEVVRGEQITLILNKAIDIPSSLELVCTIGVFQKDLRLFFDDIKPLMFPAKVLGFSTKGGSMELKLKTDHLPLARLTSNRNWLRKDLGVIFSNSSSEEIVTEGEGGVKVVGGGKAPTHFQEPKEVVPE